MDLNEFFQPGMTLETTFLVEDVHSAATVGSGSLRVLATPVMIAFMERTCHQLLASRLPQGYSSVGVHVDVRHLAPTPVGSQVKIQARLLALDGAAATFEVGAWDDLEQCGSGSHQRMVIDAERFLRRVGRKRAELKLEADERA